MQQGSVDMASLLICRQVFMLFKNQKNLCALCAFAVNKTGLQVSMTSGAQAGKILVQINASKERRQK